MPPGVLTAGSLTCGIDLVVHLMHDSRVGLGPGQAAEVDGQAESCPRPSPRERRFGAHPAQKYFEGITALHLDDHEGYPAAALPTAGHASDRGHDRRAGSRRRRG